MKQKKNKFKWNAQTGRRKNENENLGSEGNYTKMLWSKNFMFGRMHFNIPNGDCVFALNIF